MKRQIRSGLFETNSSSVHTIVVKHKGDYKMKLKRSRKAPQVVIGYCRDYSDYGREEPYIMSKQQEKFEYVLSLIIYKYQWSYGEAEESWEFGVLLEALKSVDNTVVDIMVKDRHKAGFDHQTAPDGYSYGVVNLYNERDIRKFIFNDNIMLELGFD